MNYNFNALSECNGEGNHDEYRIPAQLRNGLVPNLQGAKMLFPICPEVSEAMASRVHKRFGYTFADSQYLTAVIDWMKARRGLTISEDVIITYSGVLDALLLTVQTFAAAGEGVIVFSPNYHMHTEIISKCGRVPVHVPLRLEDNWYSIDFEKLEKAMQRPENKVLCLCNPDNPTGRVWSKEELAHIAQLANQYDILVFSDEIFAEINMSNVPAIPMTAALCGVNRAIVASSLSKAFNLVGTRHANLIIENKDVRDAFVTQRDKTVISEMDPFMYMALLAAYRKGGAWLDEAKQYIRMNMDIAQQYFDNRLPMAQMHRTRGIYLAWIDWHGLRMRERELEGFLLNEARLGLDMGGPYGAEGFTRFCMAIPRQTLLKSLENLDCAVQRLRRGTE